MRAHRLIGVVGVGGCVVEPEALFAVRGLKANERVRAGVELAVDRLCAGAEIAGLRERLIARGLKARMMADELLFEGLIGADRRLYVAALPGRKRGSSSCARAFRERVSVASAVH